MGSCGPIAPGADASPQPRRGDMRVLVVEPSLHLQRAFSRELAAGGHLPICASSLEEALAVARQSQPPIDVILLDACPDLERAVSFLLRVGSSERLRGTPVAALAYLGAEDEVLRAGARRCLRSVPEPGEVLHAVRCAFELRRPAQAAAPHATQR